MTIEAVLQLRKEKKYTEAKNAMLQLLDVEQNNAEYHYQMAWCYDNLGQERDAVPHYVQAISLGLSLESLEGAYVGLGSTYRSLGQYAEAKETLEAAILQFPNANQLKVFYVMTLYNLQEHSKAMEIVLKLLAESSHDESIVDYKQAILYYADKLDEKWD
ncbi:Tetratrico peptide repeat protein [compost metagenome]